MWCIVLLLGAALCIHYKVMVMLSARYTRSGKTMPDVYDRQWHVHNTRVPYGYKTISIALHTSKKVSKYCAGLACDHAHVCTAAASLAIMQSCDQQRVC